MHFLLMLLLAVACIPRSWPQPLGWVGLPANATLFAALTWGGVFLLVAAAIGIAQRACRRIRLHPGLKDEVLFRYARARRNHLCLLYLFVPLSVYGLGWGWTVQWLLTFDATGLVPAAELLIIGPFLIALVLSWLVFYNVDRTVHRTTFHGEHPGPFWGRGAYVLFQARQHLALVGAAILLLIGMKSFLRIFPWLEDNDYFGIGVLCMIPVIFCLLPLALRFALGLRPLPEGSLRDRLEGCARRLQFRHSDILLWDTNGTVANAMVAGLLPFLRYVLLTDRLLSELTPDEIEAVFGHEIGHVKHRHMSFYMWFLLISVLVVAGLWGMAVNAVFPEPPRDPAATAPEEPAPASRLADFDVSVRELQVLPLMTILGAYIFVVFGFLSRRCERQADIYGCRAVSCARLYCMAHEPTTILAPAGTGLCHSGIRTFISALEKVASLNGISRHRPGLLQSWQHSTIARRVEFLQRVLDDPFLEARFQRAVTLVKWTLLLTLCGVLFALCQTQGWNHLGK